MDVLVAVYAQQTQAKIESYRGRNNQQERNRDEGAATAVEIQAGRTDLLESVTGCVVVSILRI
jgi:hypothetical protein